IGIMSYDAVGPTWGTAGGEHAPYSQAQADLSLWIGKGVPPGLAERVADRLLALLRADGEAVGGDELGLDPDEVEDAAEVSLEMLERSPGRTFAVEASASERDDHPLSARKAFGTGSGVAE